MIQEYWKYRLEILSSFTIVPVNKENLSELSLVHNIPFHNFIQFIQKHKQNSSVSRGLYRREIIYNLGDTKLISEIIRQLSPYPYDPNSSQADIFMWCLNDAINSQDFTMLIDLYILYYKLYPESQLDTKPVSYTHLTLPTKA